MVLAQRLVLSLQIGGDVGTAVVSVQGVLRYKIFGIKNFSMQNFLTHFFFLYLEVRSHHCVLNTHVYSVLRVGKQLCDRRPVFLGRCLVQAGVQLLFGEWLFRHHERLAHLQGAKHAGQQTRTIRPCGPTPILFVSSLWFVVNILEHICHLPGGCPLFTAQLHPRYKRHHVPFHRPLGRVQLGEEKSHAPLPTSLLAPYLFFFLSCHQPVPLRGTE